MMMMMMIMMMTIVMMMITMMIMLMIIMMMICSAVGHVGMRYISVTLMLVFVGGMFPSEKRWSN